MTQQCPESTAVPLALPVGRPVRLVCVIISISVIRYGWIFIIIMTLPKQIELFATNTFDLERSISQLSIRSVWVATAILVGLVLLGVLVRNRWARLKLPVFLAIVITTIVTTALLASLTIYLNVSSSSGGPVHWHADFEIWACGKRVELRDPQGLLTNKIGNSSLHEHNDKRIHLEGVVVHPRDASLGKFFTVIGGHVSDSRLLVPLDGGELATFQDGQKCEDGAPGDVQIFAYSVLPDTTDGKKTYSQAKLENPQDYVIAPHSQVPPGDCFIIEFGPTAERTDRKCLQYQVQDELGNYQEVL